MLTKKDNRHASKSGPGRLHVQGDGKRERKTLKQRQAGAYGRGLMNHFNRKRQQALRPSLRDDNGALTLVGATVSFVDVHPDSRHYVLGGCAGPDGFSKLARRIWLAGISAQRGF